MGTATTPAAPVITPGPPRINDTVLPIMIEVHAPMSGLTPTTVEYAMLVGMVANMTTRPDKTSSSNSISFDLAM